MTRRLHSLDDIKQMLADRIEDVCAQYAPADASSYTHLGKYWTLNPGRADRSVGSFFVHVDGPDQGRFYDFATGQGGDGLDLIGLSLGLRDVRDQLREARKFLGLDDMTDADRARLAERQAAQARAREKKRKDAHFDAERTRKSAQRLWLSGQPIASTPAMAYLTQRRGIDVAALGRQPGALRHVPECSYKHADKHSGEASAGPWPARPAPLPHATGEAMACHRTYLALDPRDGRWNKADVPKAKKVYGTYRGGWINIWKGIGPRGGKPPTLRLAPQGTHVYVAEGIEDALTAAMLQPHAYHIAGISVSNMANLAFPPSVGEVTFIADRDEGAEAQEAMARAVQAHRAAGRRVRMWLPPEGCKDLNDAWLRQKATGQEGAA